MWWLSYAAPRLVMWIFLSLQAVYSSVKLLFVWAPGVVTHERLTSNWILKLQKTLAASERRQRSVAQSSTWQCRLTGFELSYLESCHVFPQSHQINKSAAVNPWKQTLKGSRAKMHVLLVSPSVYVKCFWRSKLFFLALIKLIQLWTINKPKYCKLEVL